MNAAVTPPRKRRKSHDSAADPERDALLQLIFDENFYLADNQDVRGGGDCFAHYLAHGVNEFRHPCLFFNPVWYRDRYPDVAESGLNPAIHYVTIGAAELRDPHHDFDAAYYVHHHPEAAKNPLAHYLNYGAFLGYRTQRPFVLTDYLPSSMVMPPLAETVTVDIVIPIYRGFAETRACLASVLADQDRPPGRVIVIDDATPEPKLAAYLRRLHESGQIMLLRNARNLGFVASANRGMKLSRIADVALLNADTEVPSGWLRRLAAHAYRGARVASVSPFSNNATICSYPSIDGNDTPNADEAAAIDSICQTVNRARSIAVPVTVGFAMYIRRGALNDAGFFDEETFGRGYGEECDFCLRATARGWTHLLACDTYVVHKGRVSFGGDAPEIHENQAVLNKLYPKYEALVQRHVRVNDALPARWAITAGRFRASGLPTLLLISHHLGGGVNTHIDKLLQHLAGRANVLMLQGTYGTVSALTAPGIPGHPELPIANEQFEDFAPFLLSTGLTRLHIHHVIGLGYSKAIRRLVNTLGLPFDHTVHDWFLICPRINFLPQRHLPYCGEPGPAACNTCISKGDVSGALDITSWRVERRWLFDEAERVLCPCVDTYRRLASHGLAANAVLAPHEPVAAEHWRVTPRKRRLGEKLRIALLGTLVNHKGLQAVIRTIRAKGSSRFSFHLIGKVTFDEGRAETYLPDDTAARLTQTGGYTDDQLPAIIGRVQPDVFWFPAPCPETFSYTMSAALARELPIVASDLGVFPERVAGRPLTWLVQPDAPGEEWLAVFKALEAEIEQAGARVIGPKRRPMPDFYARDYLAPLAAPSPPRGQPIDLRRPGITAVVIIPERTPEGNFTPCAHIRLVQPLDHLRQAGIVSVTIADAKSASRYLADCFVTQRYALESLGDIEMVSNHARETGASLVYDIDDDLLNIPQEHPEYALLQQRAKLVATIVQRADRVLVSTKELQQRLSRLQTNISILPNALDERIFVPAPPPAPGRGVVPSGAQRPVRIVLMGTQTHDHDLDLVLPALESLAMEFGRQIAIEVVGMTAKPLPNYIARAPMPPGVVSYPAFVDWFCRQPSWDIALAPLANSYFNLAKSAIKTLDFAAIGVAALASKVPAYQDSLADRIGGMLVANTKQAWALAIRSLIVNPARRQELAAAGRAAFLAAHTLGAQQPMRAALWQSFQKPRGTKRAQRFATLRD